MTFVSSFSFFFSFFLLFLLHCFLLLDDNVNRHDHFQQFDFLQDIDIFHNNNQAIVWNNVCDVSHCHSFIETSQSKTKERIVVIVVIIIVQIAHNKTRHKILVFWIWRFFHFFQNDLVNNSINVDDSVTKVLKDRNVLEIKIVSDTNKFAHFDKTILQYLICQFCEQHEHVSIQFQFISMQL